MRGNPWWRILAIEVLVVSAVAVAGAAASLIDAGAASASQANKIVSAAEKWVTSPVTPYCWYGGTTTGPSHKDGDSVEYYGPAGKSGCANFGKTANAKGFDCTGLTLYAVFQALGITLPHDGTQATAAVADSGQKIKSPSSLLPGDLVYFGGTFKSFKHSGVYIGNNELVNAFDYKNDGPDNGPNNEYWGVAKMPMSWVRGRTALRRRRQVVEKLNTRSDCFRFRSRSFISAQQRGLGNALGKCC